MCPFNTNNCGTNKTATFDKVGDSMNITMNLPVGDACFYKVVSKCGFPSVNTNAGLPSTFRAMYLDLDEDDLSQSRILSAANDFEDDHRFLQSGLLISSLNMSSIAGSLNSTWNNFTNATSSMANSASAYSNSVLSQWGSNV